MISRGSPNIESLYVLTGLLYPLIKLYYDPLILNAKYPHKILISSQTGLFIHKPEYSKYIVNLVNWT